MQLLIIAKKLVNKKAAEKYSICRLTKEFVHGQFVKDSKLLSHVFHQVLEGSVKSGADWHNVTQFGSFDGDKGDLGDQKEVAAKLLLSCLMASDKKTLKAMKQGYLSRLYRTHKTLNNADRSIRSAEKLTKIIKAPKLFNTLEDFKLMPCMLQKGTKLLFFTCPRGGKIYFCFQFLIKNIV